MESIMPYMTLISLFHNCITVGKIFSVILSILFAAGILEIPHNNAFNLHLSVELRNCEFDRIAGFFVKIGHKTAAV